MERGSGKPPFFEGTNYPYWKIHMSVYLQSINSRVWEICEDEHYEVLAAHVGQEQMDQHEPNSKARMQSFLAFRLLNLIVFLTTLRLGRYGKLLKNIIMELLMLSPDSLRPTDVSTGTLSNCLESLSIRCFLVSR
jgi:hypothetical protein